ncbi:Erythroblast macrophage protein EMP [Fasciola gigantica]|uniref:Erythroblast macrophage protein EMP n=1 Tax=Fasciola gigantica TaxID=46835 RepID=A0A504Y9K3_FASGI|nr:Erythroblast macrophage protein EMP [Fasciola gigantica]
MSTDPKSIEPLVTEYTSIKASYESINKKYRRNHKELEKGVMLLNKSLEELESAEDISKAVEAFEKVVGAVSGCKRKADTVYSEESKLLQASKRRLEHIQQISLLERRTIPGQGVVDTANAGNECGERKNVSVEANSVQMNCAEEVTCVTRFQRHLADYLFASGYPKAALKLARDRPELNELCLTELFEEAVQIEDALLRGDTGPAHNWLQEANFKLKKSENHFEFDLRVFEFYLLVREGKRMEAIQHARKYMSSVKKPDDYRATKLGQAMILLAMRTPEELQAKAEYNNLTEKWIVKRAHEVLMDFYSYPTYSPFQMVVNAGISVIKTQYPFRVRTIQCFNTKTQHRDCAVCHPLINQLAVHLPFGRHDHSVLTCYQTGLPINEDNPPMSLPNGYVYSQKGIAALTDAQGMITCPRSGERFSSSQVQKVYIL